MRVNSIRMRHLTGLIILLFISFHARAQVGGLAGAVTDAITGRELVGVVVSLKPAGKEDVTDVEGRFLFNNLQPGIYSLELKELNHKTTYVPILRVSPNEITVVKITMYDSVKALTGIIITARKPRAENNSGVAMERKSSPSVMDGISQESIKRTPDRNSSEVLRRISGITILDNKYPVIRGLGDRYNMALLNGIPLPSTLPDRKTFAFDAIPASLLDNILVVKSALPDQPGEFAGAVIHINTRDIPDESIQTVSIGLGGFGNSVLRKGQWQPNAAPDVLGLGTWGRQLPGGLPAAGVYQNNLTPSERAIFSKNFSNDWGLKKSTMMPGLQFQYSNSSRFRFAKKEAGSLFAVSYSNLSRYNSISRAEYNKNGMTRSFTEDQYTNNVIIGGLFNFSVKLNKKNKITLRNFLSNNATEENNIRQGTNFEQNTYQNAYAMSYLQNYFLGTQLAGDHFSPKMGMRFRWDGGLQKVIRNTPDFRRLLYTRAADDPSSPMVAAIGPTPNFENGGKMYSDMSESVKFLSYSVQKSYYRENFKSDIKVGGFHQFKHREFNARILSVIENSPGTPLSVKMLPVGSIFDTANMGGDGFRYDERYDQSYTYTGDYALNAGYLMLDNIIDRIFRITGGVRVESFYQKLTTHKANSYDLSNPSKNLITPTLQNVSVLPSVALTLLASNKTNIRLDYATTVSRPDFREMSPFSYFDFVNYLSVSGNDSIKTGTINNFDLRYETYPGDGQSFSIGAFYKKFTNPIEQIVNPVVADGNRIIHYKNANSASLVGVETEFRLKLKKLARKLKNWEASGNFAWMKSEVTLGKADSVYKTTRPLQGQSPYIANLGLFYYGRSIGWSFALNYNLVGPRIYSVGTVNYPDFYEKPRHIIDIQIAKMLSNRSEVKLNFGDILAQNYVLYQNTDSKTAYSTKDRKANSMKASPMVVLNFIFRLK